MHKSRQPALNVTVCSNLCCLWFLDPCNISVLSDLLVLARRRILISMPLQWIPMKWVYLTLVHFPWANSPQQLIVGHLLSWTPAACCEECPVVLQSWTIILPSSSQRILNFKSGWKNNKVILAPVFSFEQVFFLPWWIGEAISSEV